MQKTALHTILQRPDIWQAGHQRQDAVSGVPTGFGQLDRHLHIGGWPPASLIELLPRRQGIGEWQLLLPTLARLSAQERHTLLLAPPHTPYPPALASAGVDPGRVLVVDSRDPGEQLWCAEQALRSGAAACVVGWVGRRKLHTSQLRKLLLAARHGDSLLFLYRDDAMREQASPATLRLLLDAEPGGQLQVELLKQPGGWAGQTTTLPRPETWLKPSPWHLPIVQAHSKPRSLAATPASRSAARGGAAAPGH